MSDVSRRTIVTTLAASGALAATPRIAFAQPGPQVPPQTPPQPRFVFDDVVRRARDLANAPFDGRAVNLPEALQKLDFDAWREIRFRPERSLLASGGSNFRLQLFHLGHLYKRPVTVNIIRDGVAAPIPYNTALFDYGRTKLDKTPPVNLGFAGFRLHYPLNDPKVFDEAIAFLGASYFRFLGRGQRYGISARALAIGAGTEQEEFPFFREFWIEMPEAGADRATIYGLLDSESTTGAYRFDLFTGAEAAMEVSSILFPRKAGVKLGLAPLTSMFFLGENDRRYHEDFRPELHDSDGLLVHSGTGEWLWRPLRNPAKMEISGFLNMNVRGFGLLQRDRTFEHYQDLDLAYELRPSYWVEPREGWGEGRVELVELPTTDETNDNIVCAWTPKDAPEQGKAFAYNYRIVSSLNLARLSPNGRAVNTYLTHARALGSSEPIVPGSRRFIVDFAGGDLPFYLSDPSLVEVVPSTNVGRITRSFVMPNPHMRGFRAIFDVQLEPGQVANLRAFLRTGPRALTETWTYPWKIE